MGAYNRLTRVGAPRFDSFLGYWHWGEEYVDHVRVLLRVLLLVLLCTRPVLLRVLQYTRPVHTVLSAEGAGVPSVVRSGQVQGDRPHQRL